MSSRKISPRRRSDFTGPRRSIPKLNQQKRDLNAALDREEALIDTLMRDAQVRRAFERGHGLKREPMSVWHDSDQSWSHTELSPGHLPKWESLTESMKMFIGFDVGMEFEQCYTFTAHIDPAMVIKWTSVTHGFMKNVQQRLARALKAADLGTLPYCYIVETRTRSGRSVTRPHLHGYIIADSPTVATRFKVALESAFHPQLSRQRRTREIVVARGYDYREEFIGRSRYVAYMAKNRAHWDARLGKRRVHFSHTFTDLVSLAWEVRRAR